MILKAYSLFDNKALTYHQPFYAPTDGAAVRMLGDIVTDNNTQPGRHPKDFVLYCVGVWEDGNGRFEAFSPLVHVIDAIALVPAAPPQRDFFAPDGGANGKAPHVSGQ